MTDKELENWIKIKQDWIDLKCRYFTRNIEDAKELKAQAQLNMWLYRENYSRSNTEEAVEAWMFFNIKYAYFHILQQLYKKPIYYYPNYNNHELITENTILNSLETKSEINKALSQIEKKVGKTGSKVAILTAEGYTLSEIGEKLDIPVSTTYGIRKKAQKVLNGTFKERKKSLVVAYKDNQRFPFDSLKKAEKSLGISETTIFNCIKENKTFKDYVFKRELQ